MLYDCSLRLLFVPRLVLEVATQTVAGPAVTGPGRPPVPKIVRGFSDLRAVAGNVKQALFIAIAAARRQRLRLTANARGHFHGAGRPHRRPLSPGQAKERPDRHRVASASAIRRHDEPPD